MKSYNIRNYIQYKKDIALAIKRLPKKELLSYSKKELEIKFLPLV